VSEQYGQNMVINNIQAQHGCFPCYSHFQLEQHLARRYLLQLAHYFWIITACM